MKLEYASRYATLSSAIPDWTLTPGTIIIVRVDFNIPLPYSAISSDHKLSRTLTTIDALLKKQARLLLLTHLGRPQAPDAAFSTQQLLPWFIDRGYAITHAASVADVTTWAQHETSTLALFENLRFFADSTALMHALRPYAQRYVLDAFGSVHRTDPSLTLLASLFEPTARTIGLLVEDELAKLAPLCINPQRPLVYILGGGKIHDKLPLLLQASTYADVIATCPALSNSIAAAHGLPIGASLQDISTHESLRRLLDQVHGASIHLPHDYVVAPNSDNAPLRVCQADTVQAHDIIITIGPQTVGAYTQLINHARTLFFNGLPGFLDRPDTLSGARSLIEAMAHSHAYTVIGGGDSVAATYAFKQEKNIDFLSTGGGATLTLLANQPLPALDAFCTQ